MNSSYIANKLEAAMMYLCQILASQSEIELQQNSIQETNKCSTIIIFQRYISNSKTIFIYGYDSSSFIIIKQLHYQVDDLIKNIHQYFIIVQDFLQQILTQNKEICIHFINYASIIDINNVQLIQEAYKLLELPFPKSKIILWMNNQKSLQFPNDYLQIQISFNQLALIKIQRNIIKNQEIYEQFTIKQITQIQEIHQQFLQQLELCEQQVESYQFFNLIKDITFLQDIPEQIQYLGQLLMNLTRLTSQDSFLLIIKLKLYMQNSILKKSFSQQQLKIQEFLQAAQNEFNIFKQEKFCHFPKKGDNSQKCKVCQKNNKKVRKSSFVCEACQKFYKINVTLCTTKCFKLFHLNPDQYLRRKNKTQKTKVEE